MKRQVLVSVISLIAAILPACAGRDYAVSSPDGSVHATVSCDGEGSSLVFKGVYKGKTVWKASSLGLTVDGVELFRDVRLAEKGRREIDETYELTFSRAALRNHANELAVNVTHLPTGYSYVVEVRCHDNGIAYRLRLPGTGTRRVNREVAEWRLPENGTAWFGERNSSWKLMTYAGEFVDAPMSELHKVSKQGPVQMMPLMCTYPDSLYLTVMEAALFNYSGMRLEAMPDGALKADFTEPDGFDVTGEILTPWRVLMISESLDGVVNSHLLTDLAPAAAPDLFSDRSWIRPGRSVWSWWSNIDGRFMTGEGERAMIDRASDLGFEYTTLDEGWEDKPDKWKFVRDLVDYGKQRGVGVFLWRHWSRLNNTENGYAAMAAFMDTVAAVGVKGLKIDYMNGEDKDRVDFDVMALQLAAERKLMINFHGCQKPTGEARTYPNEITREAVRGMELNRITADYRARMAAKGTPVTDGPHVRGGENQCIPACHNVVLPVLRGAIGAVDYTPIGFSMPGNTTASHQLAMAFLLDSPLMTMAENPFYLFRTPGLEPMIPMIKSIPLVWDESHVLAGTELGKSLVMAKRCGDDWYLSAVTTEPSELSLSLDFLEPRCGYYGEWICDAVSDGGFERKTGRFRGGSKFLIKFAENGGMVMKLSKIQE